MERTINDRGGRTAPMKQGTDGIDTLKKYFFLLLSKWYWFLLCLILAMGCAYLKVRSTIPVYLRSAALLVKPVDNSGSDALLRDMGIVQTPSNLTNEILSITSSQMAQELVRRLSLDVDYFQKETFYDKTLYGVFLPVSVNFLDLNDNDRVSMSLSLRGDGSVCLSNLQKGALKPESMAILNLGDTVATEIGRITVKRSPYYKEKDECELTVVRSAIGVAVGTVRGRLSAYIRDNNSTIINIDYRDVSSARAEDILNTLVAVYNENWMRDRNQQIVSTNEFIKGRLDVIEQELGDVDQDISRYKSDNLLPNVDQMGSLAVSQATSAEQEANALVNQMYIVRYIHAYLLDSSHDSQLIPFSSGMSNINIAGEIAEYNNVLLQRNNHLANSSLQNPLVSDLDNRLNVMRRSIIASLEKEIELLEVRQASLQRVQNKATAKIAANPQQAKYLLSVERQQKVKEQLYLFLLQKREENELSQAFTAYNSQLIEPPYGYWSPISPVAKNIYLLALLIGLAIPAVVILGKELLKTTIQSREDIKGMTIPLAGEIPLARKAKGRKKKKAAGREDILVTEKNRDVVNEAFRVVRSNLEFMLGFNASHKVILLTSLNPGSGKTFISANLSSAIALKGKKVLAIDLDMRKGSLSEYVGNPHEGLSRYLSGKTPDYHSLIVKDGNFDILPCGKLPPNPSELLYSPLFEKMIGEAREEYDYVFLDCPPVEIVADASIVSRYADMTLFVIRAKLLEKALLPEIEGWYEQKKYPGLAIVLNGTDGAGAYHRYGYHRYGYGYGYSRYGKAAYGKTAYGSSDVED